MNVKKSSEVAERSTLSIEDQEWRESLDAVASSEGTERASALLRVVHEEARVLDVSWPPGFPSLYLNSIPCEREPAYPGDLALERRLRNLIRWNALATVLRANHEDTGIGGHISSFASCATLYEVGQNHFFKGRSHPSGGDHVYFQGHSSPGNYARAYLEYRMDEEHLKNFRHEIRSEKGLSSYPHPWLMPDFWEFPTVSMGLGPIQAIYRARLMRYLENRGLREPSDAKVWAFVGDGECDEPEALAALSLAAREKLDNLIFVVICNLQRLDGPVRGNGKIIQELEAGFAGAGWNVIKLVWGSAWDPLFAADTEGVLRRRLTELVDGEYQRFYAEGPKFARERFFDSDPRLNRLIEGYSDEDLAKLRVGGHDPVKIHAAFRAAVDRRGGPTVILAKTVKGYGLGEGGEGRNMTHQAKKLTEFQLRYVRDRFEIPIEDSKLIDIPFYRPEKGSAEYEYLIEKRRALGGFVPERPAKKGRVKTLDAPEDSFFEEFFQEHKIPVATTMAAAGLLTRLLSHPELGKQIVPIVPDEARTFGMDSLFRKCGIYSSVGQLYQPVDRANVLYYRETKSGQLLEEGITEAGAMSSFIATGTAHVFHGLPLIPFFFFYSMFGFQRIGDLIWASGDIRARGFLFGATAGRTTLAGEGLQHQDGHSHLLAQTIPNLRSYDPAYAYEIAVIVQDGIRRMHENHEDLLYYLTVANETYHQPAMPEGAREGILQGMHRVRASGLDAENPAIRLFGSGPILNPVLDAQKLLEESFGVSAEVWSVTSYLELRRDALEIERWNRLHPFETPRVPYVTRCFEGARDPVFVAASDYLKSLPDSIARFLPGPLVPLGTDGYGRSDNRKELRRFFEVDSAHVAFAALSALFRKGRVEREVVERAFRDLSVEADRDNPASV